MSASVVSNNSSTVLDSYSHSMDYSNHITGTTTEQHAMIITGDENKHENFINFQELILKIKKQEKIITAYKELTKQQEQVLCQLRKKCQSPQTKRISRYNISYSKGQKDQKVLEQFIPLAKDVEKMIEQNNKQINKDKQSFTIKEISNNIDFKINKLYRKTPPPGPSHFGFCSMNSQPQSSFNYSTGASKNCRYEDFYWEEGSKKKGDTFNFQPVVEECNVGEIITDTTAHPVLDAYDFLSDMAMDVLPDDAYSDIEAQTVSDAPEDENSNSVTEEVSDENCNKYFGAQIDEDIGIMTEKVYNDFYFLDHGHAKEAASILISDVLKTMDTCNSDLYFDDSKSQSDHEW